MTHGGMKLELETKHEICIAFIYVTILCARGMFIYMKYPFSIAITNEWCNIYKSNFSIIRNSHVFGMHITHSVIALNTMNVN